MGQLIVPRLMEAGHQVTGWNRSRDKAAALLEAGMRWAESPRSVAAQSDIVFSIVTDGEAVKAVALGPDGVISGLAKGGIYIDMSTIEPEVEPRRRRRIRQSRLDHAGRPAVRFAGHGESRQRLGDDRRRRSRLRTRQTGVLAIGPKVTRIGGNGLACQMKIAVNLLLMVEVIAFGEAVAWPEKRRLAQSRSTPS